MSLVEIVGFMIILLCIAVGYGGYLIGCWRTREKRWRREQSAHTQSAHTEASHAAVTTDMLRKVEGDIHKYLDMVGVEVKSQIRQKGEKRERRSGDLD